MARALIDSDILIDALRRYPGTADRLSSFSEVQPLVTTSVNVFEVLRGARSEQAKRALSTLLSQFEIVDLDELAAQSAATIYQELRAGGTPIDTGDTLIAGIARSRGMAVVTRNRRDFERVAGLVVLDL